MGMLKLIFQAVHCKQDLYLCKQIDLNYLRFIVKKHILFNYSFGV